MNSEFLFDEKTGLGDAELAAFNENGYVALRGFLSKEEVNKLRSAVESSDGVLSKARHSADQLKVHPVHWAKPGNDVTGVVARSEKSVQTATSLLGGEVYHYYAKVMCKLPNSGSIHWHQDYGYWYTDGLLCPSVGTLWIAVQKSTQDNGCIQFLKGSHKLGRLDHRRVATSDEGVSAEDLYFAADPVRVERAAKRFPRVHVEAEPGDAFFFHCNILRRSDINKSAEKRLSYAIIYNRADNAPGEQHRWSDYSPIEKVPNSAILACDNVSNLAEKQFIELCAEKSTRGPEGRAPHRNLLRHVSAEEQALLKTHWIEY